MSENKFCSGFSKLNQALNHGGAFLIVDDGTGEVNIMTIGWAQIGIVWGKRTMSVFVRPSRHTYSLIEKARYFSVCVPPEGGMEKELLFCGTKSGRDFDKIKECGFKMKDGAKKGIKLIEGAALSYECEIIAKSEILSESVSDEIKKDYYPQDDFHTVYDGKIINSVEGDL